MSQCCVDVFDCEDNSMLVGRLKAKYLWVVIFVGFKVLRILWILLCMKNCGQASCISAHIIWPNFNFQLFKWSDHVTELFILH